MPLFLAAPWCASAGANAPEVSPEARTLHAMFERVWEENMREFPSWATWMGDHRFDDRLEDASLAAQNRRFAQSRRRLDEASTIARDALNATDRVSLDLFVEQQRQSLRLEPFLGWRTVTLSALSGVHTDFADLLARMPLTSRTEGENMLARLRAFPARIDQEIDTLREGIRQGWVSARPVLKRVMQQLDTQLAAKLSPFFEPLTKPGAGISANDRNALQEAGKEIVTQQVNPALQRLRQFVALEYLPRAPVSGALLHYPNGQAVYNLEAAKATTTTLTADALHAIGLRELTKIRAEMEQLMHQISRKHRYGPGLRGDFAAFASWMNTAPRFFAKSPTELMTGYREISKRMDAEMPRLFAQLPRAPYGVQAMPAFKGADAAEYYNGPALDGSRGGTFFANALAYKTRPTWGMATLVAHEAVPGHHLQVSRSIELSNLPRFRRDGGYTAYAEGWALYAETLARDIGLYHDAESLFGHLQWQAFRAARLVVDTGIHAQGWDREKAIAFMTERTGVNRSFVASEVDRYTSWPGQALAYMVGKLKFDELREKSKMALGNKFDLRKFHNAVLDQGALPLTVLERVVDDWIAAQA
ncbi:MAG: DUF885 domain-containing protein [Rhodoferax sp.]|nr:DUF885 domain-containing protein [Rhodoferax sp.]MCF8208308.1 DUF885 domain-containing protein [Rhodoferax sp.]